MTVYHFFFAFFLDEMGSLLTTKLKVIYIKHIFPGSNLSYSNEFMDL